MVPAAAGSGASDADVHLRSEPPQHPIASIDLKKKKEKSDAEQERSGALRSAEQPKETARGSKNGKWKESDAE